MNDVKVSRDEWEYYYLYLKYLDFNLDNLSKIKARVREEDKLFKSGQISENDRKYTDVK